MYKLNSCPWQGMYRVWWCIVFIKNPSYPRDELLTSSYIGYDYSVPVITVYELWIKLWGYDLCQSSLLCPMTSPHFPLPHTRLPPTMCHIHCMTIHPSLIVLLVSLFFFIIYTSHTSTIPPPPHRDSQLLTSQELVYGFQPHLAIVCACLVLRVWKGHAHLYIGLPRQNELVASSEELLHRSFQQTLAGRQDSLLLKINQETIEPYSIAWVCP